MIDNLTAFQRDTLFVIAGYPQTEEQAPHGLAIMDDLESYLGHEVNHGRLYPNLDRLVEAGLVSKGERDKRTNYYTLTDDGIQALAGRLEFERSRVLENFVIVHGDDGGVELDWRKDD